jgi:hypothetical protein
MSFVASPVSRSIVKRTPVDHEDAVWHECPLTGRAFKVQRILQDAELWHDNPASEEADWAITHIGQTVLASRVVFL